MLEIDIHTARAIAVSRQLFNQVNAPSNQSIFDTLGYIQIDTISTVNRSHDHTLWTRNPNHTLNGIQKMQKDDAEIFEYWTHAMSFIPMKHYRFVLKRIDNFKTPKSAWVKNHLSKSKHIIKEVLARVRAEGPLSAKEFESGKKKGNGWWDWKPSKFALEYLFWSGELMVKERIAFRKYYDLTERVLPNSVNTQKPTDFELGVHLINQSISAYGIVSLTQLSTFLQSHAARDSELKIVELDTLIDIINKLCESGEIVPVRIDSIKDIYYSRPEILESHSIQSEKARMIHFLSPFDNLIINRNRTKELFNFSYSLECYKPQAKREYGYFVFPILFGQNLVGRMDPKADRKKKILYIKNLHFEKGFCGDAEFISRMVETLSAFAKFNSCSLIEFSNFTHVRIVKQIISELKKINTL